MHIGKTEAASASESAPSSAKTKSTLMKPFPTVWAHSDRTGLRIWISNQSGSVRFVRVVVAAAMYDLYDGPVTIGPDRHRSHRLLDRKLSFLARPVKYSDLVQKSVLTSTVHPSPGQQLGPCVCIWFGHLSSGLLTACEVAQLWVSDWKTITSIEYGLVPNPIRSLRYSHPSHRLLIQCRCSMRQTKLKHYLDRPHAFPCWHLRCMH